MDTKQKIEKALKKHLKNSDSFEIEFDPSAPDQITGVVTSEKFEGKREFERQNILWDIFDEELTPDERADIVLMMANTPEETEVSGTERVAG